MIGQLGSVITKNGNEGINAALGMDMQDLDIIRQTTDLGFDMKRLIANNACGGAPLRRFERNLIAYVTDKSPIRIAGAPTSPGPFRDSDYQTLLDDLVADQSSAWLLNRFQGHSISNVSVEKRDAADRPTLISANYAYQALDKQAEGKVELRFENGEPHCLVYADVPGTCRTVSPTIVAVYEDGKYVTERPANARTYVAPDLRQIVVVVDQSQPVLVEIPSNALTAPRVCRRDAGQATARRAGYRPGRQHCAGACRQPGTAVRVQHAEEYEIQSKSCRVGSESGNRLSQYV